MKWLRTIEIVLGAARLMPIAIYIAAGVHSNISSRAVIRAFRVAQESMANRQNNTAGSIKLQSKANFSLCSVKRITACEQSLTHYSGGPLAVLRIPKLQLEVPVFDGTDDLALNRGVGRIRGTARAGEKGDIGIAGHRDGFFRGLKDIDVGDVKVQGIEAVKKFFIELDSPLVTFHIKEVSTKKIPADGATVIDVGGRTLIPGLIDTHVQLASNCQYCGLEPFPLHGKRQGGNKRT